MARQSTDRAQTWSEATVLNIPPYQKTISVVTTLHALSGDDELLAVRELGTAPGGIASFGVDDRGELLLVTYGGTIFHPDLSQTEFE